MMNKTDLKLVNDTDKAFLAIPAHRVELITNYMITPYILTQLVKSGDVTQISQLARHHLIDAKHVAEFVKDICDENGTYNLSHSVIYQMAEKRYEVFLNNLTPTCRANWYEYK